jgi:hypothetical protein
VTGVVDFRCRIQVACLRRGGVSGSLKPEARMQEPLFWMPPLAVLTPEPHRLPVISFASPCASGQCPLTGPTVCTLPGGAPVLRIASAVAVSPSLLRPTKLSVPTAVNSGRCITVAKSLNLTPAPSTLNHKPYTLAQSFRIKGLGLLGLKPLTSKAQTLNPQPPSLTP